MKMNPYKANLINSITLIIFGLWGAYPYLLSTDGSPTSLIPCFFGITLLALSSGLKKENKIIAHIIVLLTLLLFLSLFMPLKGAIERSDTIAIIRVSIMLFTSFLAQKAFIKSFIDARKS
tara:strand:+ start:1315 stop:1674 length:360 start_codon:yes stop_codon:yes gene_type:complete